MSPPVPRVFHGNRAGFQDVALHQYKYGLHSYLRPLWSTPGTLWPVRLSILVLLLLGAHGSRSWPYVVRDAERLAAPRSEASSSTYRGVLFLRMLFVVATLVGTD